MKKQCGTCRHWEPEPPSDLAPNQGVCRLISDNYGDATAIASPADAESYNAVMYTRGDFGCNQWEAK